MWIGLSAPILAANRLTWDTELGQVSAAFDGEPLDRVLEEIATLTEWEILVEPNINYRVRTRFADLSTNQALRRFLGDLNFALISQPNSTKRLYVYRTSIRSATQQVAEPEPQADEPRGRIENELIVTLDPNSPKTIEEIAEELGATIVGKIDGLNAYRLRFDSPEAADQAENTLKDNRYASVDYNYEVDYPARINSLAYQSSESLNLRVNPNPDSDNPVVALIDTSVQSEESGFKEFLLPSISIADEATPSPDEPTHATTMAETILKGLQMSSEEPNGTSVRILPVDVYGSQPTTSTFQVAMGIYEAINAGATIVNLSLGGGEPAPFIHTLIQQAHSKGVLFVGAAGNEPGTHVTFPAAYPEVVAVTAMDRQGNIAPYANSGEFVDVMVPGNSFVHFGDQTYLIKGTSASAAYVSGIAAGIAASSGKLPGEIEAELRANLPSPPPGPPNP